MPLIPFVIVLLSVMPMADSGLRAEHVATPLLLCLAMLRATRVHADLVVAAGALVFSLVMLSLSSWAHWQTGAYADPINMFIRLALPTTILLAFPSLLVGVDRPLFYTSFAIVVAGIFAAGFAVLSVVWPPSLDWLTFWVQTDAESVWAQSGDVGRIIGIFSQPLEAGIFYSICLLAALVLWKASRLPVYRLLAVAGAAASLVGGALCLSKNFLLLGLLAGAALAVWIRIISLSRSSAIGAVGAVAAIYFGYQFNESYFDSLGDLYRQGGLLTVASAGRFGLEESNVAILFDDIWYGNDWLLGRGLGSFLPLDNGFLEYFYQGGTLALVGYLLCIGTLAVLGWNSREYPEGKLMIILAAYVAIASIGGPAISANRANVVLLALVSACVAEMRLRRMAGSSRPIALLPKPALLTV